MKKPHQFRSKPAREAGVAAWFHLQQAVCPADVAGLALEWMCFCDRTGRMYNTGLKFRRAQLTR